MGHLGHQAQQPQACCEERLQVTLGAIASSEGGPRRERCREVEVPYDRQGHPRLGLSQLHVPFPLPTRFSRAGCATTVLVTGAGIGEMVLQMLVGSVCGGLNRVGGAAGKGFQAHPHCPSPLVSHGIWKHRQFPGQPQN